MQLTEDDVAALVLQEIEQAQGYDSDVLASVRQKALELYQALLPAAPEFKDPDTGEMTSAGRSGVVSMDVADGMHALMAQLTPVLRSSLVEFPPDGQQDVASAQMEGEVVRDAITRSGGYGVVGSGMHDALLMGNGWLHGDLETGTRKMTKRFAKDTPLEAFAQVEETPGMSVSYAEDGAIQVSQEVEYERLVFRAVPPENMLFSSEPGIGVGALDQLRLIGERRQYTQAALIELGVSEADLEQIPDAAPGDDQGQRARSGIYADGEFISVQEANRLKTVYCVYVRLDPTGSGKKAELRHIWIGGRKVLLDEPAEFQRFVCGTAIPMPHRVQGTGIGGLLAAIQTGKTEVLRAFLDNLQVMNGSRVGALDGAVNYNDLTNGRLNGVVRMMSPNALFPLPSADIGPQAIAGLNYLDQVRSQRIGAALDATEVQAQLMGASATAAAGHLAQVEMMTGWFAENLAQTLLKPVYLLAHRILRTMNQPLMAKLQGTWQETRPGEWPARDIAEVTMGLTTAQRIQRIQALSQVLGQQQTMMQQGLDGVMVDKARIYNCICDWLRANDIPDPDQYVIDPSSPQAQEAAQRNAQNAQQQQQQAVQVQQRLVQMQQDFELEKQSRDLEYKRWSDNLNAEIEEAKLVAQGTQEAVKAAAQITVARRQILSQVLGAAANEGEPGQGGEVTSDVA